MNAETKSAEADSAVPPEVLKVEEVAALLRVNRNTVYVMVQRKLIPHRYVGTGKRALRFSREAVLQWLRSTQVCAQTERK